MVIRRLANAPRVLLLLDYDGTLTPVVACPELAQLPDSTRICLKKLANKERFIVGLVSGRELTELEQLVEIPGLVYVGNHGLEIKGSGLDFVYPGASGFIESITKIASQLVQELEHVPKLVVCDKKLTLSVYLGNMPDSYAKEIDRTVASVMEPYVLAGEMKILRGKKVVEVRPNIDWGKGEVIKKIHQGCGDSPVLMFFSNDRDDEDGFDVVQSANGIAVYVGPPRQGTKALHQLESPAEVAQVLELLDDLDF